MFEHRFLVFVGHHFGYVVFGQGINFGPVLNFGPELNFGPGTKIYVIEDRGSESDKMNGP